MADKIFSEKEVTQGFILYLENALIEFEQPHNFNGIERIKIYQNAFKKAILQMESEKAKKEQSK